MMIELPNPFMDASLVAPSAPANDDIKIVRKFSPAGPCLTLGRLTKTTAQFYCYDEWRGGDKYEGAKKIRIDGVKGKYSPAHIVPCHSCRDHAKSRYPDGYVD
jgi:hypothetical protein